MSTQKPKEFHLATDQRSLVHGSVELRHLHSAIFFFLFIPWLYSVSVAETVACSCGVSNTNYSQVCGNKVTLFGPLNNRRKQVTQSAQHAKQGALRKQAQKPFSSLRVDIVCRNTCSRKQQKKKETQNPPPAFQRRTGVREREKSHWIVTSSASAPYLFVSSEVARCANGRRDPFRPRPHPPPMREEEEEPFFLGRRPQNCDFLSVLVERRKP
ncbi:hypothetical protein CDAR_250931 [Caerostris darwini]|uniref:Uncharacterized protein n=1 Tax=Caerostris darwini TaxID=1538125 RepID=A0AAV4TMR9_9ARAC|nr:hypothetical protein CDAR_250931 [Caerostris darwini]